MRIPWFALPVLLAALAGPGFAQETLFTIVHTNDMHSHLQGFPPELRLHAARHAGDDATVGGWARIATVIRSVKAGRGNPVLVLDAGDFLMGSLFHMVSREKAVELRLMKAMGYDAVGLGNHEFDLEPDGLARILTAARGAACRWCCFSNAVFGSTSPDDDSLERAFADGLVRPYKLMTVNGVRIGIFALMGKEAAEVAPFASPVDFRPAVEAAKRDGEGPAGDGEGGHGDLPLPQRPVGRPGRVRGPAAREDGARHRRDRQRAHPHEAGRPARGERHDHRAGVGARQARSACWTSPGWTGRPRCGRTRP